MFTNDEGKKFSALSKDAAQDLALASLAAFVERISPNARSVKNPLNPPV
jgi:hypothetical protein